MFNRWIFWLIVLVLLADGSYLVRYGAVKAEGVGRYGKGKG